MSFNNNHAGDCIGTTGMCIKFIIIINDFNFWHHVKLILNLLTAQYSYIAK